MNSSIVAGVIVPLVLGWIIALVVGKIVIPWIKKLGLKDYEREEGLQSHKKKSGTPLMGGIIFIIPMLLVSIPYAVKSTNIRVVLILTIGFYLVGMIDDYIKVALHRNLGLRVWQKFLLEIFVMVIFTVYILAATDISFEMMIPFTGSVINLGIMNIPFMFFVALATTNGTNLTDGVDGLCGGVSAVVVLFFTIASVYFGMDTVPVCMALFGGLLGYLFYNTHPAKIFMGDGGSLALGGFIVAISYVLKMPLWIPIVGIIFVIEVVSDILQVGYFKLTHGKRIFKMAPFHHHLERCGWEETRIVNAFKTWTIIAAFIGIWAML